MTNMLKWDTKKFDKKFETDKLKAYKSVFTHNKKMIKDQMIKYSKTIVVTDEQYKIDTKDKGVKIYKKNKVAFFDKTPEVCCYLLATSGLRVAILNPCDGLQPAGHYITGDIGQEEDLARCIPTLYNTLKESGAYPFAYDEVILYSPDLQLLRNSTDSFSKFEKSSLVSVVSAYPPDTNLIKFNRKKIYNLLQKAILIPKIYDPNISALVIPSWGLNHSEVAKIFNELITLYKKYYKVICFAIPNEEVYKIYRKEFL